jgi:hypothetical protein
MNTKELYRQLFVSVLLRENVLGVVCNNTKEHYFDRIVVNSDGSISVYSHGLKEPLKGLFFDFDVDYAKLLWYVEQDLFLIHHGGNSINFEYSFKENKD